MDFLIITRFSLHNGILPVKKLFRPARMNRRLNIFKRYTYRSMVSQTSKNFLWVILYDQNLPEEYLIRLQKITEGKGFIKLIKWTGWNIGNLDNYSLPLTKRYCLTVRLDYDDILAKNFVQVTRKNCKEKMCLES